MRRAAWVLGLAAVALLLPACSKSISATTPPSPPTAAPTAPPTPIVERLRQTIVTGKAEFAIGAVDVQAVNANPELPPAARSGVQEVLDRYLDRASITPLRTGEPVGDLAGLFNGRALERLTGPDRAGLVDEGLPQMESVKVETAKADVTALVTSEGAAFVTAQIHVVVTAGLWGVPLTIERTGELLLSPEAEGWRISGYNVKVSRHTTPVGTPMVRG